MDSLSFAYSTTLIVGGAIGYLKAGSFVSLIVGLITGCIMFYGTYQTSVDPDNFFLSLIVSGILAIVMGYRFFAGRKFMPAGLIFVLSTLMVIKFALRTYWLYNKTKPKKM